jgi:uncharacterized delta-60 repeat protein
MRTRRWLLALCWSVSFLLVSALQAAPTITSQPTGGSVTSGWTTASIGVTATGTGTLSYQWKKDGVALVNSNTTSALPVSRTLPDGRVINTIISGATSATLTITNWAPADAGSYTVTITDSADAANPVTSNAAVVTVTDTAPTLINQSPATQAISAGGRAKLFFNVSGSRPLAVQWFKDGVALGGVNGSSTISYDIDNFSAAKAGVYTATVSNAYGSVTLQPMELTLAATKDPLDIWRWTNPDPQGNNLVTLTAGGGRLVLVGRGGAVISTTDGQSGNIGTGGTGFQLSTAVYDAASSAYIAAGGFSTIVRSTDAQNWTSKGLTGVDDGYNGSATDNAGTIILAGVDFNFRPNRGLVRISRDGGNTWVLPDVVPAAWTNPLTGVQLTSATFGASKFVVVGTQGLAFSSTDGGRNWTQATTGTTQTLQSVNFANGKFVAVGNAGTILTSTDGLTFTAVASSTTSNLFGVNYLPASSTWVAVGAASTVRMSTDNAATWTTPAGTLSPVNSDFYSVAENANLTAITGQYGRIFLRGAAASFDLNGWETAGQTVQSDVFGIINYVDWDATTNQFIAVGANGNVHGSSADGSSWNRRAQTGGNFLTQWTRFGGTLLASGSGGLVLSSTDGGYNWINNATTAISTQFNSITNGAGRAVVVGNGGNIFTSTNGTTWTAATSGITEPLRRITYANGQFVAVGGADNGSSIRILTSTDGLTWTARTAGTTGQLWGVDFANGTWVAVGAANINGGGGFALRSTDNGVTWSRVEVPGMSFLYGVRYLDGRWIATGSPLATATPNALAVSADNGLTWNLKPVPAAPNVNTLRGIAKSPSGAFVAVGNDAAIVTSAILPPVITSQPASATISFNGGAYLNVNVSSPFQLSYQWRRNGVNIAGATNQNYFINNFDSSKTGTYDVVITATRSDGDGNTETTTTVSSGADLTLGSGSGVTVSDWGFNRAKFWSHALPGRLTAAPGGKVYATFNNGGSVNAVDGQLVGAVVRLNADGTRDTSFSIGTDLVDAWAVVPLGDGRVLVSGVASYESGETGQPLYRVFRYNADGSRDWSYNSPHFTGTIRYMTLQSDGKLLVTPSAGAFTNNGGLSGLVRLNADGTFDNTFSLPTFNNTNPIFANIVVDGAGKIYIGGTFSQVNGVSRPGIARLNANGTLDTTWVPSGFSTFTNQTRGLGLQTQGANAGKLVVAGGAYNVGGTARPIIRLGTDGALDTSFTLLATTDVLGAAGVRPRLLNMLGDDRFMIISDRVVRLQADGAIDTSYANPTLSSEVFWMDTLADGSVLFPPEFGTSLAGTTLTAPVRLNASGTRDTSFNPGRFQTAVYPRDYSVQADGKILVWGAFDTVNNSPRSGFARLNADGTLDDLTLSGVPNLYTLGAASVLSDGRLLAVTQTGSYRTNVSQGLARFNTDGTLDSTFTPAAGVDPANVYLLPDNKALTWSATAQNLLAGNGISFRRLALDGSIDTSFVGLGTSVFGRVQRNTTTNAITEIVLGQFRIVGHYADGRTLAIATTPDAAYAAGSSSLPVTILRLNADGTRDTNFNAPSINWLTSAGFTTAIVDPVLGGAPQQWTLRSVLGSPFSGVVPQSDGGAIVYGAFTSLSGVAAPGIARLNADGAVDTTFAGGLGSGPELRNTPGRNPLVQAVAVAPDGKIWVAGNFDTFGGRAAPGLTRLNADGSVDTSFVAGARYVSFLSNGSRFSFASGGAVYLSGTYATNSSQPDALARLVASPATLAILNQPSAVNVTVGQTANLGVSLPVGNYQWQWRRNGVAIPGATQGGLTIQNATRADADRYDVVITDGTNTITSAPIVVTVAPTSYPGVVAPDSTFNPNPLTISTRVNYARPLSDGKWLVAGDFTSWNGTPRTYLAKLNADYSLDPSFVPPAFNGQVYAFAEAADGSLYVGGEFTRVGHHAYPGLARLTSSGALDPSWAPQDSPPNASVVVLATTPDNKLMVARQGTATGQGSTSGTNVLRRLNANGTLDSTFSVNIVTNGQRLWEVIVEPSGSVVFAGGSFTTVNGVTRYGVVRVSSTGTLDTTFAGTLGASTNPASSSAFPATIFSLTRTPNGSYLVVGSFRSIGGVDRNNAAIINADGTIDPNFVPVALTGSVATITGGAVQSDGRVIITGTFTFAGSSTTHGMVRLTANGAVDTLYTAGAPTVSFFSSATGTARPMFVYPQADGSTALFGSFQAAFNQRRIGVAVVGSDGQLTATAPLLYRPSFSNSLFVRGDGRVQLFGSVEVASGTTGLNQAALFNPDGSVNNTFPVGSGFQSNGLSTFGVYRAVRLSDGSTIATGDFLGYNGTTANRIVRLKPDGTADTTFNVSGTGLGTGNLLTQLLPISGGRVLLSGATSWTYNGSSFTASIVRLNADGTRDTSFAPVLSSGNAAAAIQIQNCYEQPDGKLVVVGNFTHYGPNSTTGVFTPGLARLNVDGTLDTTFTPGSGPLASVNHIVTGLPDGRMVLAGSFTSFSGSSVNRMVILNANGTRDTSFGAPTALNNTVTQVIPQEDGKLLVFGDFTGGALRLNANGTVDNSFSVQGFTGTIFSSTRFALADDGSLYAFFNPFSVNYGAPVAVARFRTGLATAPTIVAQPVSVTASVGDSFTFAVTPGGTGPHTYQWLRNGTAITGATSSIYRVTNAAPADLADYSVTVTNASGSVTSATATVNSAPIIVSHPASRKVVTGGKLLLRFGVGGSGLTYQWTKDGQPVGGNSADLVIDSAQAGDAGSYVCTATNSLGTVTSNAASVAVLPVDNVLWTQFNDLSTEQAPSRLFRDGQGKFYLPWSVTRNPDVAAGRLMGTLARFDETTGALDTTFKLDRRFNRASWMERLADGKLLIAVNSGDASMVIRTTDTGAIDPTFTTTLFGRSIRFIKLQADGKIIVAAADAAINNSPSTLGASAPTIYRLNADGTLDAGFTPAVLNSTPTQAQVYGPPEVDADGRIYLVGAISTVNGVARTNMARLNADGTLDTAFAATLPAGFITSQARAVVIQSTGRAVVVGDFRYTGRGTVSDNIMAIRFNTDGTFDSNFAQPLRSELGIVTGRLRHVALHDDDSMVVVSDRLARLTANGARDPNFTGFGFDREGFWVARTADGRYLVPDLTWINVNGIQQPVWGNGVAAFAANGQPDFSFQLGGYGRSTVPNSSRVLANGDVWVAGTFNRYGARALPGVAKFSNPTTLAAAQTTLPAGAGAFDTANPTGYVTAASGDQTYALWSSGALVRVNADGTTDSSFVPVYPTGYSAASSAIYAAPSGRVILAQSSITAASALAGNIGNTMFRLNSDGSRDTSFVPNLSSFAVVERATPTSAPTRIATGGINVAQVLADGRMLVIVSAVDGTLKLQRLNADGTLDTTFTAPSFGTITPSVGFTSVLLDPVTNTSAQWNSSTYQASDLVRTAVQMPDGKVYVGGRFEISGSPRGLVRLNSDGSLDTTFTGAGIATTFADANAYVSSLAADSAGRLYVGGRFSSFNGTTVPGLFRLTTAGAIDAAWNPGISVYDQPTATVQLSLANNRLYAVGTVGTSATALPAPYATVDLTFPPAITTPPANTTVDDGAALSLSVTASGVGPFTYQWFLNGNAITGATGSSYFVSPVRSANAGNYTVAVTSAAGTTVSNAATVTVNAAAPAFAARGNITGTFGYVVAAGSSATLSVAPTAGSLPITYQWKFNGTDIPGATGSTYSLNNWQPANAGAYSVAATNAQGTTVSPADTFYVSPEAGLNWANPRPTGNGTTGIIFANNRFVIGGVRGTLLTSTDGTTWSAGNLTGTNNIAAFAYGNNTYAAIGTLGALYYSADGQNWEPTYQRPTAAQGVMNEVVFGLGRFVAVGTEGLVGTSTDGRAWTFTTIPGYTGGSFGGLVLDEDTYYVLTSTNKVLTSTDGTTWTEFSTLPTALNSLALSTAPEGGAVAVGPQGRIYTTADGVTWTQRTSGTTEEFIRVRYLNNQYIATGTFGALATSPDGVAWTLRNSGTQSHLWSIDYGAGRYVITGQAGNNGRNIVTSTDGITWTSSITGPYQATHLLGVEYANGITVAVGNGGAIVTSADLTTWTQRTSGTSGNLSDVTYALGKFVAISSSNGAVLTSTDGITWSTQATTGLPASGLQGIAYDPASGSFVIVGDGGLIRTSTDLATWTTRTSPTGAQLRKVFYSGDKLVAVSSAGEIITAANAGSTWTRTQTGTGRSLADVVFRNNQWVAVGNGVAFTSSDGTTWTNSTFTPANLVAVKFVNGQFMAFSNNHTFFTSPDGITWTGRSSGAFDPILDAVEVNLPTGYRFVGVGNFGTILTGGAPAMPSARSISVLAGQRIDLNAHVSGTALPVTYSWTKGGVTIPGATSYLYTINAATAGDAGTYVVSANNGRSTTNQTFTVTVNTPPSISAQPLSTNLPENGVINLTVTASGTGPFTYQWFKDGVAISGTAGTGSSYGATTGGTYTVRVTSAYGTVTSSPALVTVVPAAPMLSTLPSVAGSFGPVVTVNTAAALQANLTQGTRPITFQWSFNGTDIPGATGEFLYRANWQTANAGTYAVRATNTLGASNTPAGETIHVTTEGGWRWRNPVPTGNGITRAAFVNGQFLLGGLRGTILTSPDGVAWTPRPIPALNNVFAFRYVGNRYVAMGSLNTIYISPDSITWTPRNLGIDGSLSQLQDMTAGSDGRLVAVGTAGVTAVSTDAGETWTVGNLGTGNTDSLTGAIFTLGRYFAVSIAQGRVYSSPDGASWTFNTVNVPWLRGLAYGAGRLVAVGAAGNIVTSTDGTTWAPTTSGTTNDLLGVNFLNNRFIAVGALGTILTSPDGLVWTARSAAGNLSNLQNTAFGNGRYVIGGQAGNSGKAILSSTDSVNWTFDVAGPRQSINLNAVAASGSAIVAVGNAGVILTSTDKASWSDRTFTSVNFSDVVYHSTEDRFVAVSSSGAVVTSADHGATWTQQAGNTTLGSAGLLGIAVSPNIGGSSGYVVVGNGGFIATTTNFGASTTWTRRTTTTTAPLRKVIYAGGQHVVVGSNGTILTSTDTTSWTARTSGSTAILNDVAYGANVYVTVGSAGTVLRSSDGVTWTTVNRFTPASLVSVKFIDGQFLATSQGFGNAYYVSADGLNWSGRVTGAFDALLDTEPFQNEVIGVGQFGTILSAGAPAISGAARTITANAGSSVRLDFPTWNSAEPVTYVWTKDGNVLPSAPNAPTLVFSSVSAGDAGTYRLAAANSKGTTQSADVQLVLNIPIAITAQPAPQTALVGGSASFSVTATGTPTPTYQWRRNGLDLTGQTSATLNLSNLALSDTGTITVAVRNSFGTVVSTPVSLTVNPIAPVIRGPLSAFAIANVGFVYQIGTNATPATFSASGLPAGLTLEPATGVISGTPTQVGVANVSITATNVTNSDTQTLVLTVQPPAPVITSPGSVNGRAGSPFSYTITATNSPTAFSAFNLPDGLTLSGATISGTPTASGFYTAQVAASNLTGLGSQALTLQIAAPLNAPVYSGPVNVSGTSGTSFTFSPNFGTGITSWALVNLPEGGASVLPTNLTLDTSTGVISGTTSQSGTFRIALQATNNSGVSTTQVLSLSFNPPATAPLVTSPGSATGTVGETFNFQVTANPTATSFAATGLPSGLTISPTTGLISGTPTAPGISTASLTVGNITGSSTTPLNITINSSPLAPIINSAPVAPGTAGSSFNFTLTASNTPTNFAVTTGTLPTGLSLDAATGALTGTPSTAGQFRVWVAASNVAGGRGPAVEVLFDIARALNVPVITSNGSAAGQVGKPFQYQTVATNSPQSYALTGTLPDGLTFDTATGILSGLPSTETTAPVTVTLTATNADGPSAPKSLAISIAPPPATPRITSALTAGGRSGDAFTYQITASENPTSYSSGELPAGLSLDSSTGAITGTPTASGTFNVALRATNAAGSGQSATLVITLAAPLAAPAITSDATANAKVGVLFTYQITATNTPTAYNVTGALPAGLSLNTTTGVIAGNPGDYPGLYVVTLTATNTAGVSQPQQLVITVAPADNTPVITSPSSVPAQVGVDFTYQITATNVPSTTPFPASVFLDAVNLPPGLAVSPSTGLIQGRPNTSGTFTATLVGTNANGTGASRSLTFTIAPAANAPVVGGSLAVNAQAGTPFSYQIVATNNPTSYGAAGGPSWLSVNTATGVLGGTPTGPGSYTLRLTASNSGGSSSEVQLSLTVYAAPNTPVVNSVNTASGRIGQEFNYPISATNSPTSYLADGMPPGLSLDSATGIISGTPTTSGTFLVKLSAVNANGEGNPMTLTVTIGTRLVLAGG